MGDDDRNAPGYIIEFVSIGHSVKATAFDPASLTEATVIGSSNTPRKQLAALAIRKLNYVLNKHKDPD